MDKNDKIRTAGIVNDSIVDGPGIRMVLFVQGCPHNCEGCHNPLTHDFDGGEDKTIAEILDKIKSNPLLDGITFSGGEPFCQAGKLAYLGGIVKEWGLNIITYTGYTFEYLIRSSNDDNKYRQLLEVTDYLIDGPFILEKKSMLLKFRGSENQRIIDVPESLKAGRIVQAEL